MSTREQVLAALHAAVRSAIIAAFPGDMAQVVRNDVLPERVPERGLIILRDGDPGEPEVTLSPLRYHYEHRAEAELFVQSDASHRDTRFDQLCAALGKAILADRTLGGLCDWVEAGAPEPSDLPVPGADLIKAAIIPITLHYSTSDPLI